MALVIPMVESHRNQEACSKACDGGPSWHHDIAMSLVQFLKVSGTGTGWQRRTEEVNLQWTAPSIDAFLCDEEAEAVIAWAMLLPGLLRNRHRKIEKPTKDGTVEGSPGAMLASARVNMPERCLS